MKVYVAGKVTGLPNSEVFRKFNGSVRTLKEGGHAVMSPAVLVLNEDFEHEDYMHVCFAMIDVCDAVFMQRDWRDSEGARMEREYATDRRKRIIYEDESTRDDSPTKRQREEAWFDENPMYRQRHG